MNISAARLREVLLYDPESGKFFWRSRKGRCRAGQEAGQERRNGYKSIRVDGVLYLAHRLAWLYQTGNWPTEQIDHINLQKGDNRWENLREATRSQNLANSRPRAKSGIKGVIWLKREKKWQAHLCGKSLGYFDDPAKAGDAYAVAAKRAFGEFARTE